MGLFATGRKLELKYLDDTTIEAMEAVNNLKNEIAGKISKEAILSFLSDEMTGNMLLGSSFTSKEIATLVNKSEDKEVKDLYKKFLLAEKKAYQVFRDKVLMPFFTVEKIPEYEHDFASRNRNRMVKIEVSLGIQMLDYMHMEYQVNPDVFIN